jgi:hypothetical protein
VPLKANPSAEFSLFSQAHRNRAVASYLDAAGFPAHCLTDARQRFSQKVLFIIDIKSGLTYFFSRKNASTPLSAKNRISWELLKGLLAFFLRRIDGNRPAGFGIE